MTSQKIQNSLRSFPSFLIICSFSGSIGLSKTLDVVGNGIKIKMLETKNKFKMINRILFLAFLCLITACKNNSWNNPHPADNNNNVRYSSFGESPKTLDPALSYSVDETLFIAQVYEPPLQYHYLKRPYQLVPLTAIKMPEITFLNAQGQVLPANAPDNQVAYTRYVIQIKPGILYQPHPAFAKDNDGNNLYLSLTRKDLTSVHQIRDFKNTGTRELIADDFVYEIKRLASPKLNSPIFGLMSKYIWGLDDYAKVLQAAQKQNQDSFLDLRQYPLKGAKTLDRYTYEVIIRGKYPQFIYWLAMPFFAPVPWEADKFYSQPGMQEKNIDFNWYPVGTGPYRLTENNPNKEMVLERNPYFHGETYPNEGMPEDFNNGLLTRANQPVPFIDKIVFTLEKESIPRWNKFLQGYYDASAISSDSFDQAISVDANNQPQLTPEMQEKGIKLYTSVDLGDYFWGFNMLDDVVGGYSERAKKLRHAITIAMNMEEYINIFLNGRGIAAQGPIPPSVFGYEEGPQSIDPNIYDWRNGHAERKSIMEAKKLLAEAGYSDGRDIKTGKPLILNYDMPISNAPDSKAQFDWMREQFSKLGIQLNIRATQYNRFQEKVRNGNVQIYFWGWVADYPDPENFLFLFYGPNGKVKFGGENSSNYSNPEYDRLFEKMRNMPNGPERQQVINEMLAILHDDQPWVWGFHYKTFVLSHQWNGPIKPDALGYNTLKYSYLDPKLRAEKQAQWNRPKIWPLLLLLLLIIISAMPVFIKYWRQQRRSRVKRIED